MAVTHIVLNVVLGIFVRYMVNYVVDITAGCVFNMSSVNGFVGGVGRHIKGLVAKGIMVISIIKFAMLVMIMVVIVVLWWRRTW